MIGRKVEKEFKKKGSQEEMYCKPRMHQHTGSGVYGLGFIGALVFYIQTATSFWGGVLGVLKAIIWPAMLVYKLLGI